MLTVDSAANDGEYRRALKDWESFVEATTQTVVEVDETVPELPVKDVAFRIHRDIRFSKDPTPYKVFTHFHRHRHPHSHVHFTLTLTFALTLSFTDIEISLTSQPHGREQAARAPTPSTTSTARREGCS